VKVEKQQFDELLGRLLKAAPEKRDSIKPGKKAGKIIPKPSPQR
jgi:hypothetical protein